MEQVDEAAHTATMQAQGSDRRGQGGAKATIVSRLAPAGEGSTRVDVDTDYHITGRLAMFGRGGMIEDISQRLLKEFAARLQASLLSQGGGGAAQAAPAGDGAAAAEGGKAQAGSGGQAEEPAPIDEPAPLSSAGEGAPGTEPAPPPTEASVPASEAPVTPATATAETPARAATAIQMPQPSGHLAPPTSEPIEGLALVGSVVLDRVKRNPAPVLGLLGALLLLLLLRRRR